MSVSVSPLASLDVPGLLQALDRYPYGCSEQIVSRAMPLLYVNRLAVRGGARFRRKMPTSACARRSSACWRARIRTARSACGRVGGDDIWLDAYVTDFLTRARERGFAVPQVAFNLALDRLRNFVANTTNVEENGGAGSPMRPMCSPATAGR